MSFTLNFLLFIGTAVIALFIYVRHKFTYWSNLGVPFLKPEFPFGNIRGLGKTKGLHEIILDHYTQMKHTGAKFMGMYFFTKPVVVALDLDFIKAIMVKDFNHFHDRGIYYNERDDPLSAHLVAVDGQKWRTLRAKMTPTFTLGKMKMMFPIIIKIGEEFKSAIEINAKSNSEIEIREILACFMTDVIGTCAFGLECNSLKNPDAEFRKYGKKLMEETSSTKQMFTSLFKGLSSTLRVTMTPDDVSKFFLNAVKETVAYREANGVKRNDFMDLLIELKNNEDVSNRLTVEEIAAQAFIFFVGGFETSSTTMSFAMYELAQNQEVQNKARECVRETLKKHNGELTYETMMEMTYVTQCINESLRMYPPLAVLVRSVTEDYRVPDSNVVLPKDLLVMIPAHAIQNDPAFYDHPDVYNPERFSPENDAKRKPYTFLPFGEGPRNCIGMRFGMMQARIGLAVLLNNFRFELSDKTNVPLQISKELPILTPVGGIWLKVEKI